MSKDKCCLACREEHFGMWVGAKGDTFIYPRRGSGGVEGSSPLVCTYFSGFFRITQKSSIHHLKCSGERAEQVSIDDQAMKSHENSRNLENFKKSRNFLHGTKFGANVKFDDFLSLK